MPALTIKQAANILDTSINATALEIKKAYKLLANKYHPDKGGNQQLFIKIQHAYKILLKNAKNNKYKPMKTKATKAYEECAKYK